MAGVTDTGILTRGEAAKELQENYLTIYKEPITKERAKRILEIAQEFGRRAEPCDGGFVHVVAREVSKEWPYTERFQIYNHANPSPRKVARTGPARYTSGRPQAANKPMKETLMPARTRRAPKAAPEPEPEVAEAAEFDPEAYLNKDLTATMKDYVQWWRDEVGDPDEIDSELLITLGARFYNIFQKSQFNIDQREARRAERTATRTARAAANGADDEDEDTEDEAPPPRRTRGAAKPVARKAAAKAPADDEAPARPARAAKTGGRRPKAGAAAY